MKIAWVKWRDAAFQAEPLRLEQFDEECILEEVGLLAKETETYVSLAMDWNEADASFRHVSHIPKGMIIEMRTIEPEKMTKKKCP